MKSLIRILPVFRFASVARCLLTPTASPVTPGNGLCVRCLRSALRGGTSAAMILVWSLLPALAADGDLDVAFNPNPNYYISTTAVQPDGKTLAGGVFISLGGQPRYRIGRLNADGTLDGAFNTFVNNGVECLAVQMDGRILIGGFFTSVAGVPRERIARFYPDGTLDGTFYNGSAAGGLVYALAVQWWNGKILVGGDFLGEGIFRLDADGAPQMHLGGLMVRCTALQCSGTEQSLYLGTSFS